MTTPPSATSKPPPASDPLSSIGQSFFGTALIGFSVQQLAGQGFIRLVPPLPGWIPAQAVWAVVFGVLLLLSGGAILFRWNARAAATLVAALTLLSIVCLHIPQIAENPRQGFRWTNPCKALALFGGAVAIAVRSSRSTNSRAFSPAGVGDRLVSYGPRLLIGIFLIVCGIQHFVYADFVETLVPRYVSVPFFWTYFCGVALIAGGSGVLLDATLRWAAILSGIMIFLWVFMLHLPRALSDLHQPGEMNGVFEALALSGVAFLLTQAHVRRPAKEVRLRHDAMAVAPGS